MSQVSCWIRAVKGNLLIALCAATLVACGGGGGDGGTPINGGNPPNQVPAQLSDLSVVLSRSSVPNTDSEGVLITVTSLDANRAALANVPVAFSVDSSGVITPEGTKTNATGVLSATATMGADRTSRTLKVTVAAGSITKTVTFDVVDSVTGSKVADLAMTADRSSLPSDASAPVRVTVTTLDSGRSAVGGAEVKFRLVDPSPNGDAFVQGGAGGTTDSATGQLVASVQAGRVTTKRTLTLIASSGSVERSISFDVSDPVVSAPVAADFTLALSRTNIGNAGSETVGVSVIAVDAKRNVIAGIPITYEVNNGATLAVANGLTDANGESKATVGIGSDKSNRTITVTARSAGLADRTAAFRVTGVGITSTAVPGLPPPSSTNNQIEFRVVDVNQSAMADIAMTVTPSVVAGTPDSGPVVKTGRTDANGAYVYTYTAPAQSGVLTFTAVAAGKEVIQVVTVPAANTTVPTASPKPSAPTLTLTPNVVRVNSGTDTSNRAEIRALFLASNNAPVKNVRVRFLLIDANSIGGAVSSGTQMVYSDANGVAVSSYAPADRPSPTDGVTIRACWDVADFELPADPNSCPNFSDIKLTVVAEPLSVSIGTDNRIEIGPTGLTYIKRFVLLVVDAAGNPKSDVQLTPQVDLTDYAKGIYVYDDLVAKKWVQVVSATCVAEDTNRNGAIDGAEDSNHNGQLDPRKSDVTISLVGSTKTDVNGTAVLKVEYPRNYGSWVKIKISAAAAGVLSPPAYESRWLDVSGTELLDKNVAPSFVVSPYGVLNDCTNPN